MTGFLTLLRNRATAGRAIPEPDSATRLAAIQARQRQAAPRGLFWTVVGVFSLGWWLGG